MRADREDSGVISAPPKPTYRDKKQNQSNKRNKGMVAASPVASLPAEVPVVATPSAGPRTGAYVSQPKREYPPCKYQCPLCTENHYCFHCGVFKAYSTRQKKEHATTHKLCLNCLKPAHTAEQCRSTYRCAICQNKHNSLLHEESVLVSPVIGLASASATIPDGLLMTANVLVTGTNGVTLVARAFHRFRIFSHSHFEQIQNSISIEAYWTEDHLGWSSQLHWNSSTPSRQSHSFFSHR